MTSNGQRLFVLKCKSVNHGVHGQSSREDVHIVRISKTRFNGAIVESGATGLMVNGESLY